MMNAYPVCYLNNAQDHLAQSFHLAVETYKIAGDLFTHALINSSIARGYEMGQPHVIAGMSGADVCREVVAALYGTDGAEVGSAFHRGVGVDAAMGTVPSAPLPSYIDTPGIAYWVGWGAAYCQWFFACTFGDLFAAIPYHDFTALYPVYHEMDVSHLIEHVAACLEPSPHAKTLLARYREARGLTQEQLAERAGVGLRSIQMYEQRHNDINKAQGLTLLRLSRALGCHIEDLLEQPYQEAIEYHVLVL